MGRIRVRCPAAAKLGAWCKKRLTAGVRPSEGKKAKGPEEPVHPMESFQDLWTQALREHPEVFCGLFRSLDQVANQKTGKGGQVLREWAQRTRYHWEGTDLAQRTQQALIPAAEQEERGAWAQWAALLLQAARAAGIQRDERATVQLEETDIEAYVNLDGEAFYPGDVVRLAAPAWYQAGRVIEQGYARRCREGEGLEEERRT